QDAVPRLQRELDAARLLTLAAVALGGRLRGLPVHLARVQHGIAAAADVDERRLHAGQDVLHAPEVDIADEAGVLCPCDVVLDEHAVLEYADLDAVEPAAHHHDPIDALAAGEELGLGDHRAAAARVAAVAAALLLGLQPGRALDPLGFGDGLGLLARLTHPDGRVRGVVAIARRLARAAAAAAARRATRLVHRRRAGGRQVGRLE